MIVNVNPDGSSWSGGRFLVKNVWRGLGGRLRVSVHGDAGEVVPDDLVDCGDKRTKFVKSPFRFLWGTGRCGLEVTDARHVMGRVFGIPVEV